MKKIVFSKLWKHDACSKIENICFQNKRFGRVYINQKWGSGEKKIQRFKKWLVLTPQEKGRSSLINWVKRVNVE